MKKSVFFYFLLTFSVFTLTACESSDFHKKILSEIKYWPFNAGDTITYVNEQNDTIVAVVSCTIKGFDPNDPEIIAISEGDVCEGMNYDEVGMTATSIDTNNYYHKKIQITQDCIYYYKDAWGVSVFGVLAYEKGKDVAMTEVAFISNMSHTNTDNLFPETLVYEGEDVENDTIFTNA
ncbi:MAG: hypothetical protein Q4D14_00835, partial [Bacteroidales bacterium]|nr:hypothetical protein [Bacteroidales bacterium]